MATGDVQPTRVSAVVDVRAAEAASAPPPPAEVRQAADGVPPGGGEPDVPRTRWLWRIVGPVAAVAAYVGMPAHELLTAEARTMAAVVIVMAIWWMTEAFPLPVTSLVPIVALPLLGILAIEDATSPYASPIVFLFMGGFVIALAMQRQGLHLRVALHTVRIVGTQPRRMVLGVMVATAGLSMWVSNTAATLMMLPIGLSVLGLTARGGSEPATGTGTTGPDTPGGTAAAVITDPAQRRFAACMVLAIAYSATIGGLATLIGSPPTLVMAGFVQDALGITIGFAQWMALGVPLAVVFLAIAWLFLTRVAFRAELPPVAQGSQVIRGKLNELGPMATGEWLVLVVFLATAALWVGHGPLSGVDALVDAIPLVALLSDEAIAIGAAILLLALPIPGRGGQPALPWNAAQSGLPWGVLLLFGGGLSLARGVRETGLDSYIGGLMSGLGTLPLVLLVAATALIVLLLTELTSNTATAATFVPVLAGVAVAAGVDPLSLLVPAALAATCSFMLPVGTPPNAIVYASGHVTIGQMARTGMVLNLVGVGVVTAGVMLLGHVVTGS
ncbi:SLC13 family permease [Nitriliruptor alkaliphilus]|uniref:SLC13 family permease n=1 Tax=Nitriliruptor alkaliphilus TaxID=427918 RepID=UPI0009F8D4DE|nr:SLC13 family permease [Nitriliruptor alkaliphilus]